MSSPLARRYASILVVAFFFGSFGATCAQTTAMIAGTVIDSGSGLPLVNAHVIVEGGEPRSAITDAHGRFRLTGAAPGVRRLRAERDGYQPAESADLTLVADSETTVTLALGRAPSANAMHVIGATSTVQASSLQRASTISRTLSTETLAQAGVARAGDALRELPGITNSIAGDTASLADDIPLQVRGIGVLETTTAFDGHPIALGFPGGYNAQISPLAVLRGATVTYGSGSNLLATSAIGGVVNFQTLEPTAQPEFSALQGWGTFDRSTTTLRATGTQGRLGYAFAYGVTGADGPIHHQAIYQPGAAYDQSATAPAVRALGLYDDDSSATVHSGLAKLRYQLDPGTTLTATTLAAHMWENKSGNGDGDYLDTAPALAFGNLLLSKYSPAKYPSLPACPAGTFVATNANGQPNGFGQGGTPDGGTTCQSPQQYAAFNTGYDGAGPAFQTLDIFDAGLHLERVRGAATLQVDAFTNSYDDVVDRTDALPFVAAPGDSPQRLHRDQRETESGASLRYDVTSRTNTIGIGYSYLNLAYDLFQTSAGATSLGAPIVHQSGWALRDVYHVPASPLSVFTDALVQTATQTNTTSLDPRASIVYAPSARDVLRLSAGATTTQPSGSMLDQPFVAKPLGGAGGGAAISCGGLNAIGAAPSSASLHPERGVDEEFAYGHGFGGDSQAQLTLYDVAIHDKLYSTIVPLAQSGTAFIDPAYLTQMTTEINAACGAGSEGLVGLTGTFNVGTLRARGMLLSGRQRFDRRTFLDYDWSTDSTALLEAPVALLKANHSLVPGSQLPRLPLHTLDLALDRLVTRDLEVRYTYHWTSAGNTKDLPAYAYSDLRLSAPVGRGTFTIAVDNLFNQWAFSQGLRYEGAPLALNAYAPASAYAAYTGAAATELFGLPARSVFFSYEMRSR